jgi:RimJ/RimL family protein N-acetyltransferase
MSFRRCQAQDIPAVAAILAQAHAFMREQGLPQWQGEYPNAEDVKRDVEEGIGWVLEEDGVVAYAALREGLEPTYAHIEGAWHGDEPYLTLHRVAVSQYGKGYVGQVFAHAAQTCRWLRIDTHEQNRPMRRAIEKFGFKECGVIYVADGTPRIAYDKRTEV